MKVAIYTRVSTDMQVDGFSLDEQTDKLMDYIERHKLELFRIYTDPGVSAKDLNRPGIKELLRDFEAGLFDVILVHKLDRLTRNIGDLHNLVELVNKRNRKLISYSEDIDTSTPGGRMFVYFLGIIAQLFRENLAEEVRKGMTGRAKRGLHNVTVPLYGYDRTEDGQLVVIPDQAETVRWIFDQYIRGIGTTNIAKMLNDKGIRRNQGAKWDQHKVMMTITNLHYIGKIHWKAENLPESERIIRDGTHESIVSKEVFDKAQNILKRRREGTISRNSYEYIFGGIIRCAACGGGYKGKYNLRDGGTVLHRKYACSNNERYGTCKQSGISEKKLTKLLFDTILFKEDNIDLLNVEKPPVNDERDHIMRELAASEARRSRWQLAYGDGMMPYADFSKRMKEEMERVAEWEKQLGSTPEIEVSQTTPEEVKETMRQLQDNWEWIDASLRKELIQKLFRKIVIHKEGNDWQITEVVPT